MARAFILVEDQEESGSATAHHSASAVDAALTVVAQFRVGIGPVDLSSV